MGRLGRVCVAALIVGLAAVALASCDGHGENITCSETFTATGIKVAVRDSVDGLSAIANGSLTFNAHVIIPTFTRGTKSGVTVTATRVNPAEFSILDLAVTDSFNGKKECDPTIATVGAGRPGAVALHGVPITEHVVTVHNGTPGLRRLLIAVNTKSFRVTLKPGATRTVDLINGIAAGRANTMVFSGDGRPGSSANIMLWDGVTSAPHSRGPLSSLLSIL